MAHEDGSPPSLREWDNLAITERSFGSPGAGGAMGFADPTTGVGYGYVTSRMGTKLTGDPRDVALRKALDSVLPIS